MAKKKADTSVGLVVEMREIELRSVQMTLAGDSPLIVHNFSLKAQAQMLAKHCKVPWPKEAKLPALQYEAATYHIDDAGKELRCPASLEWIADSRVKDFMDAWTKHMNALSGRENPRYGFPAVAFKACAIRGAKSLGLVMADMRGAFHIPVEYVTLDGDRTMRSDMVRISHSTSDVRFRAEFQKWSTTFDVVFNASVISPTMIFNMFTTGGFSCGIGEWRPEKGGDYGRFHVQQ